MFSYMNAVKTNNTILKKMRNKTRKSYGKKNLKNNIFSNENLENNLSPLITYHYN